ncbi:hypothetical protein [Pseudomonas soli]|uniref:hypothetical protein n=1 Tax=Pseudomonas soli TaxID=1306993 RepID=UPI00345C8460
MPNHTTALSIAERARLIVWLHAYLSSKGRKGYARHCVDRHAAAQAKRKASKNAKRYARKMARLEVAQ